MISECVGGCRGRLLIDINDHIAHTYDTAVSLSCSRFFRRSLFSASVVIRLGSGLQHPYAMYFARRQYAQSSSECSSLLAEAKYLNPIDRFVNCRPVSLETVENDASTCSNVSPIVSEFYPPSSRNYLRTNTHLQRYQLGLEVNLYIDLHRISSSDSVANYNCPSFVM